jgi:3-hydroxybutyryl-CoA dehydratase
VTLDIGASASRTTTITAEMVETFGRLVGDTNPVHFDDAYAANTIFKKRVAHGMLTASLCSALLAHDLPGPGTIYLSQTVSFKKPVYLGDAITAAVEVTAYRPDKKIATLRTTCTNQDGALVLEGEAVVLAP